MRATISIESDDPMGIQLMCDWFAEQHKTLELLARDRRLSHGSVHGQLEGTLQQLSRLIHSRERDDEHEKNLSFLIDKAATELRQLKRFLR